MQVKGYSHPKIKKALKHSLASIACGGKIHNMNLSQYMVTWEG